jgi:CelD/BcsL family acetyltransferase involved in cellulose biosynthesis
MEVVRFVNIQELQVHAAAWDRLASGVPFRSWAWLATWWRHYGASSELYVLGVFDHGELVGIAPWYRTVTRQHGRTLRLLGDTEVCSEYGTILCQPGRDQAVAAALADWLLGVGHHDRWDIAEISVTHPDDPMSISFGRQMAERGCRVHSRPGAGCWRVTLPSSWDDYLRLLSRDRRKKLRRMVRKYVDNGRAVWHTADTPEQLAVAQGILIDLHQRRRNTLGQPGCFAWPRYRAFHEEVLPALMRESNLGLHWVEFEGQPIAAEYHLLGHDVLYCYQGGIEPKHARLSPGQIATVFALQRAIEQGFRVFDFLRGDEPYKRHWRARLRQTVELRVVAPRTAARLRHGIWLTGLDLRQWTKDAMGVMHLL